MKDNYIVGINYKYNACLSHNSDNWRTPKLLYDYFMKESYIDLFEYCSNVDQYEKIYKNQYLFINPPYSHLNTKKFCLYIDKLIKNNNFIVLLIPSRTDTRIFHHLLDYCYRLFLFQGRLHFNDSKKVAPFPSCLLFLHKGKQFCTLDTGTLEQFITHSYVIR